MKTLTTLTAVAALIAGISFAAAQTTAPKSGTMSPSPHATGSGKFCVEVSKGGSLNCKFASMQACEKEAQAQGLKCSPNPSSGTTGSKQ